MKNYIAEDYNKIRQLIDDQKLIRDGIQDITGDLKKKGTQKDGEENLEQLKDFIQEGKDLCNILDDDEG